MRISKKKMGHFFETKSVGGYVLSSTKRISKLSYFFIGFISGIVFFIAFVFVGNALLNEDYDAVTIEDFEPPERV